MPKPISYVLYVQHNCVHLPDTNAAKCTYLIKKRTENITNGSNLSPMLFYYIFSNLRRIAIKNSHSSLCPTSSTMPTSWEKTNYTRAYKVKQESTRSVLKQLHADRNDHETKYRLSDAVADESFITYVSAISAVCIFQCIISHYIFFVDKPGLFVSLLHAEPILNLKAVFV